MLTMKNWKALAIGMVGAVGALGAVSLSAQSGEAASGGDIILRDGANGIWHAARGQIRHCIYDSTYATASCTRWQ